MEPQPWNAAVPWHDRYVFNVARATDHVPDDGSNFAMFGVAALSLVIARHRLAVR